jgi:outer membrane lipoprotein-sorting protein
MTSMETSKSRVVKRVRRRVGLAVPVAAILLGSAAIAAAREPKPPAPTPAERAELAAILAKFDETQASTRTLTASFTERKEIHLLREPVVSKGRFFYTKPDDVLLQYTDPEPRTALHEERAAQLLSTVARAERATARGSTTTSSASSRSVSPPSRPEVL